MSSLNNEITDLMTKLENNEISWEEYKLKLNDILNAKKNDLEIPLEEEKEESDIIYENNTEIFNEIIDNKPSTIIHNILLHDEDVIKRENEISSNEIVELNMLGQKPNDKTPTIIIQNLSKKFKNKQILNNISFNIYPGEIHLLTGPCSSGKSIIIKSIICSYPKNKIKGKILINNRKNYEIGLNKNIGFVPEIMNFSKKITVKDYLNNFALLTTSKEKLDKRINKIINKFNLDSIKKEKISSLSSGEKRKVFLAQALIDQPDILIFDQPEAYLDYNDQIALFDYLNELKNKGKTILIVSNNLHEMNKYATYCTIINKGEVVFDGLLNKNILSLKDVYKKHVIKEELKLDQTNTILLLDKIHS